MSGHYALEDDVPDDWRPLDQRKWSREELLAEIDALNAEVAKWVGVATERKGAVSDNERLLNRLRTLYTDLAAPGPMDAVRQRTLAELARDAIGGK